VRSHRRILLAIAALLSVSALLAVGILLAGRFGETEGRILRTTALLGAYGLVALPSTMLVDQRRATGLAAVGLALAALAAWLALVAVWSPEPPDDLGRAVGNTTVLAVLVAQLAALTGRRRGRDPASVQRLYLLAWALGALVAVLATAVIWTGSEHGLALRILAALAVLDLLATALQPLLARARPAAAAYRLELEDEMGELSTVEVEAADLGAAAAKAIRSLEQRGHSVHRVVLTPSKGHGSSTSGTALRTGG
jgi:hypothetical protein